MRGRSAPPDDPPYGLARNISIHTSRTRTRHKPKLSLRSVLGLLDCELVQHGRDRRFPYLLQEDFGGLNAAIAGGPAIL